jgi:hypothetical protein
LGYRDVYDGKPVFYKCVIDKDSYDNEVRALNVSITTALYYSGLFIITINRE